MMPDTSVPWKHLMTYAAYSIEREIQRFQSLKALLTPRFTVETLVEDG